MERKPAGCIGCGYCCIKTTCLLGKNFYGVNDNVTICPGLKWDATQIRHICELALIKDPLGARYRSELHIGAGCCSGLNSWRREPIINRVGMDSTYKNPIPPLMQKFIRSLSNQFISGDTMTLTLLSLESTLKKDGIPEHEISHIKREIIHQFKGNRSSFTESFCG